MDIGDLTSKWHPRETRQTTAPDINKRGRKNITQEGLRLPMRLIKLAVILPVEPHSNDRDRYWFLAIDIK